MRIERFDYGAIHADQQARLGIGYTDHNGERWGYVRIREAMKFGEVVRSSKMGDLVTTSPGVVVSPFAAVGSDRLPTTDGFQLSSVTQDLTGAIGIITAGGGIGQQFYILENDGDTAKVFVLTGNTNRARNKGWVTALATDSRFVLFFPGEGRQGDGVKDHVEGIMQAEAKAADLGKFCWVKRSGLTSVLCDGSGNDLIDGSIVVSAGAGLVADYNDDTATITLAEGKTAIEGALGRAAAATSYENTQDYLALVDLDIPDGPLSYAFSDASNGYNEVVIR